jgi:hypothetical protein
LRLVCLRDLASKVPVVGLLLCAVVVGASAQTIDDPAGGLAVGDRARPGYDPAGVRLGSFLFYPSLTTAPFYDSNIFATSRNAIADSGIIMSPRLTAASQFSRHALDVEIGADRFRHRRQRSEDRTDLFASAKGRLDIRRDTVALATLEAR